MRETNSHFIWIVNGICALADPSLQAIPGISLFILNKNKGIEWLF